MSFTRRHFLSSLVAAPLPAAPRLPNIIFILIDDYGWRDTSYNGSTYYQTPNVDRLARSGMVFTNGYSASPVCSPTRAAIMTGKYPARLHVTAHLQGATNRFHYSKVLQPNARLALPLAEITIAELLRGKGYRCACIGKWHLGAKGFLPGDQGFDVAYAGDEAGSTSSFFYPQWRSKVPLEGQDGDYLTDRLTALAVNFIRENKDRPFFLYLPHFAVHTPIEGKPDKVRKFDALSDPANPQNYGEYAAMIESIDESTGRVLDTLAELGLEKDTLVIFTADNGGVTSREWKKRPITSNLPLRSGKGHLYEGGIRVPTVVRWEGVTKAGSTCDTPIQSIDYAPTIAEAAGIERMRLPRMDGRSFVPLLKGGEMPRRDLFWHFPHYSPQLGKPSAAIRNGDDKLILFFEDSRVELYDLKGDIGETNDLAKSRPEKAAAMRRRLEAWLVETKAQIPRTNPKYDPAREREAGPPDGATTAK
ncbi:MAG: sulfatase [Candidatus Solibacter usitatus]|nr:sulfatase [Candidatus Solibacter usitatus]